MGKQTISNKEDGAIKHGCCGKFGPGGNDQENIDAGRFSAGNLQITLVVGGMTCKGCADRIERAVSDLPGVSSVAVDLDNATVMVSGDLEHVDEETIRRAIISSGFSVSPPPHSAPSLTHQRFFIKPYHLGIVTMIGAVGFYLGLLTLTSDWYNAKMQFGDYRWWLIALAVGLGLQVTLYAALRRQLNGKRLLHAANTSVAASGGMSTAAMAACCSHYLAVFLPLIGLPFLSTAAASLEQYQVEFFAVGVFFNTVGVILMSRQLQKYHIPFGAALQ